MGAVRGDCDGGAPALKRVRRGDVIRLRYRSSQAGEQHLRIGDLERGRSAERSHRALAAPFAAGANVQQLQGCGAAIHES